MLVGKFKIGMEVSAITQNSDLVLSPEIEYQESFLAAASVDIQFETFWNYIQKSGPETIGGFLWEKRRV